MFLKTFNQEHAVPGQIGRTGRRSLYLLLSAMLTLGLPSAVYAAAGAAVQTLQQQKGGLKGTVVDEKGEPVIGATVKIKGSGTGAITDLDGNFTISDVAKGATLEVTYIGYETQSVTVASTSQPLKIRLKESNTMLNDVEVVAYGTQKKVTVTGAISSIKGEELTKTPTSSVANVLAGQVSGLSSIQYSGEPGSDDATLYIRGKATFANDGATPLVQIDGVTREMSDFTQIDPNEIESISVLKDASATAVFGVQGANGVILVTTKRGKEGKANISFSSNESIIFPTKIVELANAYQYATYYNMAQMNDGVAADAVKFSPYLLERFQKHDDPIRFPDTNWTDYVMKNSSFQTQNNINISGGTKTVRYFVSAGMMTQGGMFKEFQSSYHNDFRYKRFNYRANLDMDVTKTTQITFSLSGKVDDARKPNTGNQSINTIFRNLYYTTPFSSPGIIDGKMINTSNSYTDLSAEQQLPFVGKNGLTSTNYYGTGAKQIGTNTLIVDLALNQKLDFITKGLSFKLKGAYNSWFNTTKTLNQPIATYIPVLKADGTIGYKKSGENEKVSYSESNPSPGRNWYFEASFSWARNFGKHHFSALALYNQRKEYYPGGDYDYIPRGLVGLVGRVTYDWNTRYMVEFNAGYNGSENFAPDRRFGFFPAGSVGWIASEESFWKPLKPIVSYFKVRATWGLVGNDKIGGYRFLYTPDMYGANITSGPNNGGYGYPFGGDGSSAFYNGAAELAKHNADVTWETAFKQNYGVDVNFFNDKLRTTFDYYFEKRRDILLTDGTFPGVLGFTVPMSNGGSVDSWGWELSARWADRIGKDFNYYAGVNLSYNQNKIIDRKEAPNDNTYQYSKGHRIGSRSLYKFYKYYYEGIEDDYQKEFGKPFPTHSVGYKDGKLKPGDATYVDLNGDGKIDTNDTAVGFDGSFTDDPQYTIGLNLGFNYKGWSFAMQWAGAWNVSRLLSDIFVQPFYANDDKTQGGLLIYQWNNSWTEDNPSQSSLYPRATFDNATNNYASSTLYEVNSSYLRLKSFSVAYDFDFPLMHKLKINTLQLSLSGYNMLTFTDFIYGDPETTASSAPSYPLTRSFALGIKLGF